jgi:hypothetical protein
MPSAVAALAQGRPGTRRGRRAEDERAVSEKTSSGVSRELRFVGVELANSRYRPLLISQNGKLLV